MWPGVLAAVGLLAFVVGIGLFAVGAFGVSSRGLRRRLPVKSPFDLMHLGGMLISVGLVLLLVGQALR